jgi:hypothetical protein
MHRAAGRHHHGDGLILRPDCISIKTPRRFYSTAPSREFGKFDVLKGSTVIETYDSEAEAKQHIASLSTSAPAMSTGGQIWAAGSLIGHGGEEMDSAWVVASGKAALAGIIEMVSGDSASPLAGPSIIIKAQPVHITSSGSRRT